MVPLVALTVPFADAARRKPGRQMGCNGLIGGSLCGRAPWAQPSLLQTQVPQRVLALQQPLVSSQQLASHQVLASLQKT